MFVFQEGKVDKNTNINRVEQALKVKIIDSVN